LLDLPWLDLDYCN
jgi:chromosome segregation ATPase